MDFYGTSWDFGYNLTVRFSQLAHTNPLLGFHGHEAQRSGAHSWRKPRERRSAGRRNLERIKSHPSFVKWTDRPTQMTEVYIKWSSGMYCNICVGLSDLYIQDTKSIAKSGGLKIHHSGGITERNDRSTLGATMKSLAGGCQFLNRHALEGMQTSLGNLNQNQSIEI